MSANIDLDFIQKPALSVFGHGWLGWAILFAGLAAVMLTWQVYQQQQNALLQVTSQLNQLHRQTIKKVPPKNVRQPVIAADKKAQIQDAVAALTTPWNALLNAIEKPDMRDIALLSFTPNLKGQQLILEAEAKNLQAALNYVDALQAQPMFDKVYLQKHIVSETDVSKPVKFNVFAHWQEAQFGLEQIKVDQAKSGEPIR